jgi:arylsulfatase A-like enzyme
VQNTIRLISPAYACLVAVFAISFACSKAHATENYISQKPNIVFIMADDLGYADIGAFGSTKIRTPHIDQLSREGARYTQFYSGAPVCSPARDVLLTGLHTGHSRIRGNRPLVGGTPTAFENGKKRLSLTGEETTIATGLKEAGYATGISGKWGIGEQESAATPTQMGFDQWLGYLNQNHADYYYSDFLWRNQTRQAIPENTGAYDSSYFDDLIPDFMLEYIDSNTGQATNQGTGSKIYSNDLMRDFALDFIRTNRQRPFFLYLPVTIPHKNMEVPSLGIYADKDWPDDAKIYAAMVSRLDSYVGDIVNELQVLGISENTIVIFTSDNGPADNEVSAFLNSAGKLRGTKASLYEGGLKVPLIIKWPNVVPPGSVDNTPWMFVDVFPTLLDIAGGSYSSELDGLSLLPTILGQEQDTSDRLLYWEFPKERLWQAGRLGSWKGIRQGMNQPLQLFDLQKDPLESRDVSKNNPEIVKRLETLITQEHIPSPHWPVD